MPALASLSFTDLIALGTLALIYLCGLGWAAWQARRATRARLYWVVCLALIAGGTLASVIAHPDALDGGKMAAGFALGVGVIFAGLATTAAGCAWQAIHRLRGAR